MANGLKEKDRGWKRIEKSILAQDESTTVKVGAMDGVADRPVEDGVTNAQLLAIHEFGTDRIPARPALSGSFKKNEAKYKEMTRKVAQAVLLNKVTVEKGLGLLGAVMAADVKNYITQENNLVPNAESTIAQKGSDRPLVDTGRLVGSISWQVVKGKVEDK